MFYLDELIPPKSRGPILVPPFARATCRGTSFFGDSPRSAVTRSGHPRHPSGCRRTTATTPTTPPPTTTTILHDLTDYSTHNRRLLLRPTPPPPPRRPLVPARRSLSRCLPFFPGITWHTRADWRNADRIVRERPARDPSSAERSTAGWLAGRSLHLAADHGRREDQAVSFVRESHHLF